ncbi:MAG: hypothetical protein ACREBW_08315, partial [Candidatus Micrarchaeaceae archaeon]
MDAILRFTEKQTARRRAQALPAFLSRRVTGPRRGGTKNMPWYRIEMSSDVAPFKAVRLITEFTEIHFQAGAPPEALVYHCALPAGDHIYYFSPEAAAVAGELLRQFGATSCPSEPD